MEISELKKQFVNIFGDGEEASVFCAPGRVNLIGEHTDYNGGFVFPCALSFGIYGVARKRKDSLMRFASLDFDLQVEADITTIAYDESHGWANYPIGIVNEFLNMGYELSGFELLVKGDIPNGAGLSSSAAIEVLTAIILKDIFNCDIDMVEMVKLTLRSENSFIGVNCGIMDQFVVGMGKKNYGVFLNCIKLEYRYIPIKIDGYKIVIANTNKRRTLSDSKYNDRRAECEKAVAMLNGKLNIALLGDISEDEFNDNCGLITDPVLLKRATHVVKENGRVLKSIESLEQGDIETFGRLMNESHKSLRDLYEVSCKELDVLVESAWKTPGVIGSRMTGAGFGGCTVSIVKNECIDHFIKQIGENYSNETELKADFYIAEIGDGARKI